MATIEDSNLMRHAFDELTAAGWFEGGDLYDGMVGPAVMKLMETFADQGHSGMSASLVMHLFSQLADFKELTPLTDHPREWHKVDLGSDGSWQNRRRSSAFSTDGGKTYYDIDEKWWLQSLARKSPWRPSRIWRWIMTHPRHKTVHNV